VQRLVLYCKFSYALCFYSSFTRCASQHAELRSFAALRVELVELVLCETIQAVFHGLSPPVCAETCTWCHLLREVL
jgi:hypothetical protein